MSPWPRRELAVLAGVLAAFGVAQTALDASGLRWQHTESLPVGLYRVARLEPSAQGGRIARGAIVLWCLDAARGRWARARGYLMAGSCPGAVEALGKVVLAVAGDTIDWTPDGVRHQGCVIWGTRPAVRDAAGRRLVPIPWGRYVLAPETVWLYSPYSRRSLDSRYFGPIATASIRARAHLVWAARSRRESAPRGEDGNPCQR